MRGRQVARPDAAAEAVARVVGAAQHVVEIVERKCRNDRAEDLLAGDAHVVSDVGKHGRRDEVATGERPVGESCATGRRARALRMEILNGDDASTSRLIQPKVEAEVAFVVGRDLAGQTPSWAEFLACIASALPAIEIVDSAITDWKISLVDTVADNASSGLYVLGDQPLALGAVSLGEVGMQMTKNGQVASIGTGAAASATRCARRTGWRARWPGAARDCAPAR